MHEVLARTCRDIESRYGREFSVSQLLNQLKTGTITVTNRRKNEFRFRRYQSPAPEKL